MISRIEGEKKRERDVKGGACNNRPFNRKCVSAHMYRNKEERKKTLTTKKKNEYVSIKTNARENMKRKKEKKPRTCSKGKGRKRKKM
jgi:hypothetical protein